MSAADVQALNDELETEDAEPQRWQFDGMRNEKGQYIAGSTGNPGGMGSAAGVVAYVKSQTNDCFEMVDLFVTVMRGEKLKNSDFVAGPKERMQAASELFDRAIGKPKQTIEETGDEHGKEVLASLQALLHVRSADDTGLNDIDGKCPVCGLSKCEVQHISAIDQMKANSGRRVNKHGMDMDYH